ncbi:MAG: hypothetical protein R6X20_00205 [Phycisphaerae bacterium]
MAGAVGVVVACCPLPAAFRNRAFSSYGATLMMDQKPEKTGSFPARFRAFPKKAGQKSRVSPYPF